MSNDKLYLIAGNEYYNVADSMPEAIFLSQMMIEYSERFGSCPPNHFTITCDDGIELMSQVDIQQERMSTITISQLKINNNAFYLMVNGEWRDTAITSQSAMRKAGDLLGSDRRMPGSPDLDITIYNERFELISNHEKVVRFHRG